MKKIAIILWTCILFSGCTNIPKADSAKEEEIIRNLEDQWTVANQTKDTEKVVSFWSPDGVQMAPNSPAARGLEEIREMDKSFFGDTTYLWESYSFTIDKIEVSASGDIGYDRGINDIKKKTPNGIVHEITKNVAVWKKIDGQWKCIVNIWNSDKP